jgi:hypothetical protein
MWTMRGREEEVETRRVNEEGGPRSSFPPLLSLLYIALRIRLFIKIDFLLYFFLFGVCVLIY